MGLADSSVSLIDRLPSQILNFTWYMMAESGSLPSPTATDRFRRLALPFIVSYHRLFINLASKALFEAESTAMVSPTSILDARPFSALRNPFRSGHPRTAEPSNRAWEKLDSRHVGLGIVDSFDDTKSDHKFPNAGAGTVVFGSQLKIHVPPLPPPAPAPAPTLTHPRRAVSAGEMALSEDYTCVIAHGPNPRTTHIFDDRVIDGFGACPETGCWGGRSRFPVEDFLSFCHACKQPLGPGKDIYMYRGEKAFCSVECRSREMLMEEETGSESDDAVSAAAFD